MTDSDAITLALGIMTNAALAGFIFGFVIWFFARPEKK